MSKKRENKAVPHAKFEDALARLEVIVGCMEKGDLPLDESLKIFEEGVHLSKNCLKMLEEAERKVEILLEDKDGKKRPRLFESDDAGEDETGENGREFENRD